MSQQSPSASWIWDPDSRRWYWYDSQTDEFVFQNGQRVRRPAHYQVPRTIPTPRDPAFSTGPTAPLRRDSNYTTQPTQRTSAQPLPAAVQPARTSSLQNQGSTDRVSHATLGLESLTLQRQPLQPSARQTGPSPHIGTASNHGTAPNPFDSRTRTPRANQGANQPPADQAVQTHPARASGNQITNPNTAGPRIRTYTEEDGTTVREDTVSGVVTRISPEGGLLGTGGTHEALFDTFQKRSQPRKYFVEGRVFFILWAEPAGESTVTGLEEGTHLGRYGQRVFSKVRRFVVIRESSNSCVCLAIFSHREQGVAKSGTKKSDFSIIYTSKTPPEAKARELPVGGEAGMRPFPIRVSPDDPSDKLSDMSRLDYSKPYTVHHNVKVRNLGTLHPHSMDAVKLHYQDVWDKKPVTEYPPELVSKAPVALGQPGSSRGNTTSNAPATLRQQQPRERRDSTSARSRTSDNSQSRRELQVHQSSQDAARSRRSRSNDAVEEDEDDDDDDDQTGPDDALQASARAAVQRMVKRGFSKEAAIEAVKRNLAQRTAIEEEDSESGDGSDSERTSRTKRSGPSREGQQRIRRMSQTQPTVPPRSSSRPQDPRQAQDRGGTSRTETASRAAQQNDPRRQAPHQQSSRGNDRDTRAAQAGSSSQDDTEAAIRRLMAQGYSREGAIRHLRKRRDRG